MARVSIEDCLDFIENRFALVSVASDRTRKLIDGAEPLLKTKNKEAVTALREIADGLVVGKSLDFEEDDELRKQEEDNSLVVENSQNAEEPQNEEKPVGSVLVDSSKTDDVINDVVDNEVKQETDEVVEEKKDSSE